MRQGVLILFVCVMAYPGHSNAQSSNSLYKENDPNRALLRKDAYGIAHRVFVDPHILGVAALASMKF